MIIDLIVDRFDTNIYNVDDFVSEVNVEKVPTWALPYMINGDPSDLTDEEIQIIDNCGFIPLSECDENGFTINNEYSHPYFSRYPAFGLPCEVEDWIVRYK